MRSLLALIAISALAVTAFAESAPDACAIDSLDTGLSPYYHDSTSFTNNLFNIVVAVPKSFDTKAIRFSNAANDCYALSNWIVSDLSAEDANTNRGCFKLLTLAASWSNLYNKCGGHLQRGTEVVNNDLYVSIKLQLTVDADQTFNANLGAEEQALESVVRPVSNALTLKVRFPTKAEATSKEATVTNLLDGDKVPAQAILKSAKVVGDVTNPGNTKLHLDILTVVTYPDVVASISWDADGMDAEKYTASTPAEDTTKGGCNDNTAASQCQQTFGSIVSLTSADVCNFNGAYKLTVHLGCKSNYDGVCPERTFGITLNVKTLNHCPELITAKLDAVLQTYTDNTFQTLSSSYLLRKFVHAKFTTSSETADIESTEIVKLVMTQAQDAGAAAAPAEVILVDNKDVTTAGDAASCTTVASTTGAPTVASFKCKLIPAQIVLAAGANRQITWTVTALVAFKNAGGTSTTRRLMSISYTHKRDGMLPLDLSTSDHAHASAVNFVIAPAEAASVSPAAMVSPSVFFFTIISVVAAFFAKMM